MNYITKYDSPVGTLTIAGNETHITGLWIQNQKYFASTLSEVFYELTPASAGGISNRKIIETEEPDIFHQVRLWLHRYFSGEKIKPDIPLAPNGSTFRQRVWEILLNIPYGETVTYGHIAKQLELKTGLKQSARSVGGAVSHNPISILIPCHRVIGANGKMTGYAGGIDKKIQLLKLEGY